MKDDKVKTYKNPSRQTPEAYKKYVPQYKLSNIEPELVKSSVVPENTPVVKTQQLAENPRLRNQAVRQPYAEAVSSPIGAGKGQVPNVGNNMEHTWSSINGQIVDDLEEEYQTSPDNPMIDNNDEVTPTALGVPDHYFDNRQSFHQTVQEDDIPLILKDLEVGSVLLLVKGTAICSGPSEEIEDQVRALIFGEHEMCDGVPVDSEDIIVLKKLKMKVGVFLE